MLIQACCCCKEISLPALRQTAQHHLTQVLALLTLTSSISESSQNLPSFHG